MQVGRASELGVPSERIRQFYTDHWPRPVMLSDARFYDWQIKHGPYSKGEDACIVAYDEEKGAIAGVMGICERDFYLRSQKIKAADISTWVVSKDYRSTGMGAKLLIKTTEEFDLIFGAGVGVLGLPVFMRSGFRYIRHMPRFIKVLNVDAIKAFGAADPLGVTMAARWSEPVVRKYRAIAANADSISGAFASARRSYNMFTRTADDLAWRYTAHPYFNYQVWCVGADNSGTEAVVAFRIHTNTPGLRLMHVTDLFGADCDLDAARGFIEDYAASNGIDAIDFSCTTSGVYRHLVANGWFSVNDDNYLRFPHLFAPLDLKDVPTQSLIYWAKDQHMADLADFGRLYLTKQDVDMDRPTPYEFPVSQTAQ